MIIDATFWVAVSFFLFIGVLVYFKIPDKINTALNSGINTIKNEVDDAEKLKEESKNILSEYAFPFHIFNIILIHLISA